MERQGKCRCLLWLLLLLTAFLAACGRESEDSYIYVAEKISASSAKDFKVADDYLYYRQDNQVYRLPVETFINEKSMVSGRETVFTGSTAGKSLCSYSPDGEGGGYYVIVNSMWDTGEILESALVRQQVDGTENYRLDLGGADLLNASLAVDGKGRAFLLARDSLYVVDAEGKLLAEIPESKLGVEFQSGRGNLLEGEKGSVYYSPSDYYNLMYEVSGDDAAFREGTFRMNRIELPCKSGKCYSTQQGIMCGGTDGMLYQYKKEDSRWEALLRFGDSNLKQQPYQMLLLSEEHMAAYYDYPDHSLYFLTKADASLLPEQKELVLALTGQLLPDLERYITEFNQESGYHVTVESIEELGVLDAMMLSSAPPDLILYGDDDFVLRYAQKGLLEDLGQYLDASEVLNRGDFLENVIEAYTIDGRLVCIPKGFIIQTVLGRTAQVGTAAGWTAEEATTFVETYPESQMFKTPTFTSMVTFFWEYILENYIDWERGECSFDSEEFQAFIKWLKNRSNGFGNGYAGSVYDSYDTADKRIEENQLLCLQADIDGFEGLLQYEMRFGEDITAIGYPTHDGRVRHTAYVYHSMGITAKSKNKATAWQFVEGFLSKESQSGLGSTVMLSTQRERLMEMAEKEMLIDYALDSKGEISLYQAGEHAGEPVMNEKGKIYVDGEYIPYYYLTQEQIDAVLEIVENIDFTPKREGVRYDVISILMEELGPYIEGKRSLEESARILQNRVQNLVQENM